MYKHCFNFQEKWKHFNCFYFYNDFNILPMSKQNVIEWIFHVI